jgi:hypothetical protein
VFDLLSYFFRNRADGISMTKSNVCENMSDSVLRRKIGVYLDVELRSVKPSDKPREKPPPKGILRRYYIVLCGSCYVKNSEERVYLRPDKDIELLYRRALQR